MIAEKIDLKGVKTVEEAFDKAPLRWSADPVQLITSNGMVVDTHKAIVRSDTQKIVGVVGKDYSIVQNPVSMSLMDTLVQYGNLKFESATIFGNGEKIYLTASGGYIKEAKFGDRLEKRISIVNSFNGTTGLNIIFWINRLVCSNGLRRLQKDSQISIRHSGVIEDKIESALKVITRAEEHFKEFEITCQKLVSKVADKAMVDAFMKELVGDLESTRQQNMATKIEYLFQNGLGNHGQTAWDLYNGYTEAVDHHFGSDEAKRLATSTDGNGMRKKIEAFEFLANY